MANVTVPGTGEQLLKDATEGGTVFPAGGLFFGGAGALSRVTGSSGLPVAFDSGTSAIVGQLTDAAAADGAVTNKSLIALTKGVLRETQAAATALGGTLAVGGNLSLAGGIMLDAASIWTGAAAASPKFAKIDAAASGANTLVAAVSGKRIRVLAFNLVAADAVTATFKSNTTALSGAYPLLAGGGVSAAGGGAWGVLETAAGEALTMTLSAAKQVSGTLTYVEL